MQRRKSLSRASRQHRHKAVQLHSLDWKQATQENNKNKNIKHENNYLLTNMTKNTQIRGKTVLFFIV